MNIPFNKPYITGSELSYISECFSRGHVSGNGEFTQKCHHFFEDRYGFSQSFFTTSCTDALEMCAMLLDIKEGDEVIIPSYTFVSTALAFTRQGARIRFVDSREDSPSIDEDKIEELINQKTKAIVVVHYAGFACDMDKVMSIAKKYNIYVVEDAAQAIEGKYKDKYLGGIGDLGTFSFHETKNIQCGEGGLLIVNNKKFINRAEIIWEKGTNRAKFFRGEINKYGWVDTGSSFLSSDILAAVLYAQLEQIDAIQEMRKKIWNIYYDTLSRINKDNEYFMLPLQPDFSSNNAHMFYMVFSSLDKRTDFISYMKERNIATVFHYLSLHKSEYYLEKHDGRELSNADRYSDALVRLPLYYDLYENGLSELVKELLNFFTGEGNK